MRFFEAVIFGLYLALPAQAATPNLPTVYIDTSMPTLAGNKIAVVSGGNLQQALNSASCGDTVALAPGAIFTGNFTIPFKSCNGWIVVRTDIPDTALPPPGERITPSRARALNFARVVTPNVSPALQTAPSARNFRFLGIEVTELSTANAGYLVNGVTSNLNYRLVALGDGSETSVQQTPENIIFDRVYFWARQTSHVKRAVEMNGRYLSVIDSYIESMKGAGQDTQAISGFNGVGPFKIVNNYLEGAGENIIFGGSDPKIPNLVSGDIEIRGNYIYKPIAWKTPFQNGTQQLQWSVKNSFETKNAERVLFEGNYIENSWAHAQTGFAFVIKSANQSGGCTWCTSRDILIRYNIVSTANGGTNNQSSSSPPADLPMVRIRYENNLFKRIADPAMGGGDEMIQIVGTGHPLNDLTIEHNTFIFSREVANALVADQGQSSGFVFANNIISRGSYGMRRSGSGEGIVAFNLAFSAPYVITGNVIARAQASLYPAGNFFPSDFSAVGFINFAAEDYALAPTSPYKNRATDGKDPGADMPTLLRYTEGAVSGVWPNGIPALPPVGTPDLVPPSPPIGLSVGG